MALRIDDISINTILGHGSAITGNIKINGFVRIDGDIDGNLETDGNIIIGENARIRGNVKAKSVIVGGIVLGNIEASQSIKVLATSAVIGDIVSHKVQVEQNAIIHGHFISIKDEQKFLKISDEYLQALAIKQKVSL
ncbi:MAG: polymer-forming cytoskeletal protein [Spirochaetia bacterium]|nr:polymer-forming cytoskeletal protein [Spirochaetia bacterium]MDD7610420.1 polymer-forming cytoskeletal protein [Spirochaetales bacterium]MDY5914778.1 polymer-forming cytoskeletal protein [Treponema sp.]